MSEIGIVIPYIGKQDSLLSEQFPGDFSEDFIWLIEGRLGDCLAIRIDDLAAAPAD
jgi:hypothetical protein